MSCCNKFALSALSEVNVGDVTYHVKFGCIPIFHPNLMTLYSIALYTGNENHLTLDQIRLWHRYLYAYDENDATLRRLDKFLGSFYVEGSTLLNPEVKAKYEPIELEKEAILQYVIDNLPIASKTQRGIVQIGANINVTDLDGKNNVNKDNATDGIISTNKVEIPPLVLPLATKDQAGVVKIGDNINVDRGIISVPIATDNTLGVVKVGDNINVNDGNISVNTASKTQSGVVKIGDNINVNDGNISVPIATNTTLGVVKAGENTSIGSEGQVNAVDTICICKHKPDEPDPDEPDDPNDPTTPEEPDNPDDPISVIPDEDDYVFAKLEYDRNELGTIIHLYAWDLYYSEPTIAESNNVIKYKFNRMDRLFTDIDSDNSTNEIYWASNDVTRKERLLPYMTDQYREVLNMNLGSSYYNYVTPYKNTDFDFSYKQMLLDHNVYWFNSLGYLYVNRAIITGSNGRKCHIFDGIHNNPDYTGIGYPCNIELVYTGIPQPITSEKLPKPNDKFYLMSLDNPAFPDVQRYAFIPASGVSGVYFLRRESSGDIYIPFRGVCYYSSEEYTVNYEITSDILQDHNGGKLNNDESASLNIDMHTGVGTPMDIIKQTTIIPRELK